MKSVIAEDSSRPSLEMRGASAEDRIGLSLVADTAAAVSRRVIPVSSRVIDGVYASQREPSVYLLQLLQSADRESESSDSNSNSNSDLVDAASTWTAQFAACSLEACCVVLMPRVLDAAEVTGRVSRYSHQEGSVR